MATEFGLFQGVEMCNFVALKHSGRSRVLALMEGLPAMEESFSGDL